MTEIINPDLDIFSIDKYSIIEMLKEEQIIRYSRPIQELYTEQYYKMMAIAFGALMLYLLIKKKVNVI